MHEHTNNWFIATIFLYALVEAEYEVRETGAALGVLSSGWSVPNTDSLTSTNGAVRLVFNSRTSQKVSLGIYGRE